MARISLVKPDKARAIEVRTLGTATVCSCHFCTPNTMRSAREPGLLSARPCHAGHVQLLPGLAGLGLTVTAACCPDHPGAQDMLIMAARRGQIQEKVGGSEGCFERRFAVIGAAARAVLIAISRPP